MKADKSRMVWTMVTPNPFHDNFIPGTERLVTFNGQIGKKTSRQATKPHKIISITQL